MEGLINKNVLVTGAAGEIGQSICHKLASLGANIIALGRTKVKCENLAKELTEKYGITTMPVECDVTNKQLLEQSLIQIHQKFDTIHHIINVAGGNMPEATTNAEQYTPEINLGESFWGIDMNTFSDVTDLNFLGTVLPVKIFGKDLIRNKSGCIVNISSMAATLPLTRVVSYSAAKAAVDNFTKWLAVHLAKSNIRVNAVSPGFILTAQNRFLLVDKTTHKPTARGKKILDNTPVGRYGNADEISGIISFLLSEEASFITGTIIPVDGGFSAYSGV